MCQAMPFLLLRSSPWDEILASWFSRLLRSSCCRCFRSCFQFSLPHLANQSLEALAGSFQFSQP